MEAAIEGYLEICKLLILNVEDKNPSNNNGFIPFYAAAKNRYLDIYKFIAGIIIIMEQHPLGKENG